MSATATIEDVLQGRARWCVVCADNATVLPTMPDKSVAHVITDPPYDARTHAGAVTSGPDRFEREAMGIGFSSLTSAIDLPWTWERVASRWLLAFSTLEQLGEYATGAGALWVRAGVWDKIAPSPQISGDRPAQAVDGIAIMHAKGRKRWNRGGGAGIWRCAPQQGADRPDHPTPKPVALMVALIEDFTDPDELVLDPYCGSGSTGVACLRLGRRFIGIEKDATYAQVARDRLVAEGNGQSLREARAGQLPMFGAP